jgi:ketosteroid isomerase-like protein
VTQLSNHEVVERYTDALSRLDLDLLSVLLAGDVVEDYPQSGERIVGRERWIAMQRAWPEVVEPRIERVVGSEDQWVPGPTWALMRVTGTGDDYWIHGRITYANGETWHVAQLITLRDGRIVHIRSYFAAPFPAAEWRRPYVEQMPPEA